MQWCSKGVFRNLTPRRFHRTVSSSFSTTTGSTGAARFLCRTAQVTKLYGRQQINTRTRGLTPFARPLLTYQQLAVGFATDATADGDFTTQAASFLSFLHNGIADMLEVNDTLSLDLGQDDSGNNNELSVFVSDEVGTYTFQTEPSTETVVMISPVSGCV